MNLSERERHVRSLMIQHGVGYVPFVWGRGKRQMGCVTFGYVNGVYVPKQLTLSKPFAQVTTDAEFTDTVLHEIAHILAGKEAGHGPVWRTKARSIGCKATRCSTVTKAPEKSVIAKCPTCGEQRAAQHRLPLSIYVCSPCKRKNPNEAHKYILDWYRNGVYMRPCEMPARYQQGLRYIANKRRVVSSFTPDALWTLGGSS